MMEFLVVMNFILIVFAFFLIILLFLRQNRYHGLEKKIERFNRDMEETASSFLIQMKEENDKFLEKLRQEKDSDRHVDELKKIEKDEAIENERDVNDMDDGEMTSQSKESAIPDILPFTSVNEHDRLLEEVKQLLEAGYTIEEIAKQLKKGKTEIELLVKFTPSLFKIAEAVPKKKSES